MIVDAASGQVFEEIFELGNGCICCSLRGQLQQVLENILQRREAFDHIVVETTGLVNPGPVAAQFWADDDLESKYYLDAIVTVVDARNLLRHLDDKARPENAVNEAERQIGKTTHQHQHQHNKYCSLDFEALLFRFINFNFLVLINSVSIS